MALDTDESQHLHATHVDNFYNKHVNIVTNI